MSDDKPIVIAALLLEFETTKDVKEWLGDKARTWSRPPMRAITGLTIETASGPKDAPYGSWIVGRSDGAFDVLTAQELAQELALEIST